MRFGGYLVARGWSRAARPAPWQTIWIAKSPIPAAPFRRNPRHQLARPRLNHLRNRLPPWLHRLLPAAMRWQKTLLLLPERAAMLDHHSPARPLVDVAQRHTAMTDFVQLRPDKRLGEPARPPGRVQR